MVEESEHVEQGGLLALLEEKAKQVEVALPDGNLEGVWERLVVLLVHEVAEHLDLPVLNRGDGDAHIDEALKILPGDGLLELLEEREVAALGQAKMKVNLSALDFISCQAAVVEEELEEL